MLLAMPKSMVSKMRSKTSITQGHCVRSFLVFLLMPILFNQALSIPVSSFALPRLTIRGEVNPVSEKFATIGDPDMPGLPNFSVLSKDNVSHWEPDSLIMTTTRFIPGQSLASFPLDNGYTGFGTASAGPFFEFEANLTNHEDTSSQPHQGWPLDNRRQTFATVEGFYDCQSTTPRTNYPWLKELGCESVISGIPYPLAFDVIVGDQVLNASVAESSVSGYVSWMDFHNGLRGYNFTWSPAGANFLLDLEMTVLVSRNRPNVAATEYRLTTRSIKGSASILSRLMGHRIRSWFTGPPTHSIILVDRIDGRSAVRSFLGEKGSFSNSTIYVSNHPDGLPDVTAWTISTANISNGYTDQSSRTVIHPGGSNGMSIGQKWNVHLVEGKSAIFDKYIGVASSDHFPDPKGQAFAESQRAAEDGFQQVLQEHSRAWNVIMDPDRLTDYRDPSTGKLPDDANIRMLHASNVVSAFSLLQNLNRAESGLDDEGVPVAGLASDAYAGDRFWDQELWMFPPVAITWPHYARQFAEFRIKQYQHALQNAQATYVQEKYPFNNQSALYPWTSGRWGNATATGPVLDYEYHINGDVALMLLQLHAITGDDEYFAEKSWPVVNSVIHTIATLLQRDGDGWSLNNMTDPDEYANNINNGAFTLGLFSEILTAALEYRRAHDLPINETWVDMAANVNIPRSASGIVKEYRNMPNNVTVKQADVQLLIHPLDSSLLSLREQRVSATYYHGKQSPDGPAMTYTIEAVAENQIALTGVAAFMLELQAQEPYLRAPFYQMSEQANDDANANGGVPPAIPFLTGHGGALQIVPFGYLGLKPLAKNPTFRPALPHPYEHLKVPDFYIRGNRVRAVMNSTHTNLTRLPPAADVVGVFDVYPNRSMPVTIQRRSVKNVKIEESYYNLNMNETITVKNDMYWQRLTTPNNILQGQPTSSKDEIHTAQYPGSATDGNFGTRWQPLTTAPAVLNVDTSMVPPQRVTQMNFDWGPRVPSSARVAFTNRTDLTSLDGAERIIDLLVVPNQIYGARAGTPEIEVVPYKGNRTTVDTTHFGNELWSGKFVMLEIQGCPDCGMRSFLSENGTTIWESDGLGATVGEFEVIGERGTDTVQNLANESAEERQGTKELLEEGDVLTSNPKEDYT